MGCTSSKAMEAQARMEAWDGEGPMPNLGKGGLKSHLAGDSPNHIVALTSSTLRKYSPTEAPPSNGVNQWGDEKLSKVAPSDLRNSPLRSLSADDKYVDPLEEVVKKMKDDSPLNEPRLPNNADGLLSPKAHLGKHARGMAISGIKSADTPAEWEAVEPETIDVWELMEGIEDEEGGGDSKTGAVSKAPTPKSGVRNDAGEVMVKATTTSTAPAAAASSTTSPKVESSTDSSPLSGGSHDVPTPVQHVPEEKTKASTAAVAVATAGGPEPRAARKMSAPPAPGSSSVSSRTSSVSGASEPAASSVEFEPSSPGKRQKVEAVVAPETEAAEKEIAMKESWMMPKWTPSARAAGSFDAAVAARSGVSSDSLAPGDAISPSEAGSDSLSHHRRSCPEELASLKGMLNQTLSSPASQMSNQQEVNNPVAAAKKASRLGSTVGGEHTASSRRASDAESLSNAESSSEPAAVAEAAAVPAPSTKTKKKGKKSTISRTSSGIEGKDVKEAKEGNVLAEPVPKEKVVVTSEGTPLDMGKLSNRSLSMGSMSSAGMSQDMDIPLFDPDLLASFEEAFQSVTEEEWHKGFDGEKDLRAESTHSRTMSATGTASETPAAAVAEAPATATAKPKKKTTARGKTPSPGRKRPTSKSVDATSATSDKAAAKAALAAGGGDGSASKPRRDRFGTASLSSGSASSKGSSGSDSVRKVLEEAPGANSNAGEGTGGLWPPLVKKSSKVTALAAAFQSPPPEANVVVDKKEVIVSHATTAAVAAKAPSGGGGAAKRGSVDEERVRDVPVVSVASPSEYRPLSHIEWGMTEVARRHLGSFDEKPPPRGEGKLVLYTTTMRAVRKTFEDCNNLRQMLQAYNVAFDERDVSMHSEFREELRYLLGKLMPVPRLFIFGRYIGGATEVEQMNEEGTFEDLLAGLPSADRRLCGGCGNVRFLPCPECSGSCKIIVDDEVERCPDCNENGLVRCPLCT